MQTFQTAAVVAVVTWAASAAAQESRSTPVASILQCRAITAGEARLKCFDRAAEALSDAATNREIVVLNRQQVDDTKRSLFGLPLSRIDLFEPGKGEGTQRIESTVTRASRRSDGRWVFILADGARWTQTDTRDLGGGAKAGDAITIRRAAMGSYMANVRKQIAIRVKREID